jgi:hypothetical protein
MWCARTKRPPGILLFCGACAARTVARTRRYLRARHLSCAAVPDRSFHRKNPIPLREPLPRRVTPAGRRRRRALIAPRCAPCLGNQRPPIGAMRLRLATGAAARVVIAALRNYAARAGWTDRATATPGSRRRRRRFRRGGGMGHEGRTQAVRCAVVGQFDCGRASHASSMSKK